MTADAREAKRQRLLDAAELEFARRGYYGTTVANVAARAGVADGTIYLYFKRKEDLLISIFERAMDRFIERGRTVVDDPDVPADRKLRAVVELHLTLLGEDRDLAVIFQVEFRHTIHVLELLSRNRFHQYLELIASVIAQGKREGTFRPELDPLLTAKMVFGVLDEMVTDWVLSKKNVRVAGRADAVSALVLGGLKRGG